MARGYYDWKSAAPQKGLLQLLREGNAFGGAQNHAAIDPLHYNYAQLWNPVDSGVGVLVERLSVIPVSAATIYWYVTDVELPNFDRNGLMRKGGAVSSSCRLNWDTNIAPTNYGVGMMRLGAGIWGTYFPVWFWLDPGYGFEIVSYTQNSGLENDFTWFEFVEY